MEAAVPSAMEVPAMKVYAFCTITSIVRGYLLAFDIGYIGYKKANGGAAVSREE